MEDARAENQQEHDVVLSALDAMIAAIVWSKSSFLIQRWPSTRRSDVQGGNNFSQAACFFLRSRMGLMRISAGI